METLAARQEEATLRQEEATLRQEEATSCLHQLLGKYHGDGGASFVPTPLAVSSDPLPTQPLSDEVQPPIVLLASGTDGNKKKRKAVDCPTSGDPSHPFSMEGDLTTTLEVWQEHTQGMNGKMSIVERDEKVPSWRQQARVTRQFYFVRKEICSTIKAVAATLEVSTENAVMMVNNKQLAEGWSLTSLRKWIAQAKSRAKTSNQCFVQLLLVDLRTI